MKKLLFLTVFLVPFFFMNQVNAVSSNCDDAFLVNEQELDYVKNAMNGLRYKSKLEEKSYFVCSYYSDEQTIGNLHYTRPLTVCAVKSFNDSFIDKTKVLKCDSTYHLKKTENLETGKIEYELIRIQMDLFMNFNGAPVYHYNFESFDNADSSSSGETSSISFESLYPYFILIAFCSLLTFLAVMWKRRSYL